MSDDVRFDIFLLGAIFRRILAEHGSLVSGRVGFAPMGNDDGFPLSDEEQAAVRRVLDER